MPGFGSAKPSVLQTSKVNCTTLNVPVKRRNCSFWLLLGWLCLLVCFHLSNIKGIEKITKPVHVTLHLASQRALKTPLMGMTSLTTDMHESMGC